MEKEIKIFVTIDGIKREMYILPSQEALVRKAAKLVDKLLIETKSKWRVGGDNNYMTMVAFQLAYEKILTQDQQQEGKLLKELDEIKELLSNKQDS